MRGHQVNDWHIKEFISHVHKEKKNWNRTKTEEWLRPQGILYRSSAKIRRMSIIRLPRYDLYNSRRTVPLKVLCFLQLHLNDVACTLHQCFIFQCVELHTEIGASQICRRYLFLESRTIVCIFVMWWLFMTVNPATDDVCQWRKVHRVGGGKSGCVSVEDDCHVMITTSTNSEQDNIFDCCQELQFDHIYTAGAKLERETISCWMSFILLHFYAVFCGNDLFWAQQQKMIHTKDI